MLTVPTREAYEEFQQAYDFFNARLFDGHLAPCLITFQREKRTYGYFSAARFVERKRKTISDEIALNPCYFALCSPKQIMQTLVHEMVHLWQEHFGKPSRRCYHNTEWADKMESVGLMPSDTGQPGGKRTGQKMADYPINGGPFDAACSELLEGGFTVSWMDRFLPVEPHEAPPATEDRELAKTLEYRGVKTPANRSNRTKYKCPKCQSQVWGKPGLSILCGLPGCNVPFEPLL